MNEGIVNDSRDLSLPESWIDEIGAMLDPDWDRLNLIPEISRTVVLTFSKNQMQSLEEMQTNINSIMEDLSQECAMQPVGDGNDQVFSLTGASFHLICRPGRGRNTNRHMAFVSKVSLADRLPRKRAARFCARFIAAQPWDEEPTDLLSLYEEVSGIDRARQSQLREIEEKAFRLLNDSSQTGESREHSELHGEIRKRYGAVKALFRLLEQKAQVDAGSELTATVLDSRIDEDAAAGMNQSDQWGSFEVELEDKNQTFKIDSLVEINGHQNRGKWTKVIGWEAGKLELAAIDSVEFPVGQKIKIKKVPNFGMRHHGKALDALMTGRVEGKWTDLANLLSKPGELRPPSQEPPPSFFCDEDPALPKLNTEQRKAVTGALNSNHAFFIQGPPGTGKTTVITEIIQQLVSRGERVLLLAPTHVAVDEVLRRIGKKDGILALRLSHDDSKVRNDLKEFTLANAKIRFVKSIRRPSSMRAKGWNKEIANLKSVLDWIQDFLDNKGRIKNLRIERQTSFDRFEDLKNSLASIRTEKEKERLNLEKTIQNLETAEKETKGYLDSASESEQASYKIFQEAWSDFDELQNAGNRIIESTEILLARQKELDETRSSFGKWEDLFARESDALITDLEKNRLRRLEVEEEYPKSVSEFDRLSKEYRDVGLNSGFMAKAMNSIDFLGIGNLAKGKAASDKAEKIKNTLESERTELEKFKSLLLRKQIQMVQDGPRIRGDFNEKINRINDLVGRLEATLDTLWNTFDNISMKLGGPNLSHQSQMLPGLIKAIKKIQQNPSLVHIELVATYWMVPKNAYENYFLSKEKRQLKEKEHTHVMGQLHEFHEKLSAHMIEFETIVARKVLDLDSTEQNKNDLESRLTDLDERQKTLLKKLGYSLPPSDEDLDSRFSNAHFRLREIEAYPELEKRWFEITGMNNDESPEVIEEIAQQIGSDLLKSANVICATTVGIAGKAGDFVKDSDFDTLIVDEASRVTDCEFLIGARVSRRWVLVGDEKQLPPYVEQEDEHHLHALAALARFERKKSKDLDEAIVQLSELWKEDEELHQYRADSVRTFAERMIANGTWNETFRNRYLDAYKHFERHGEDADREFLWVMIQSLVRSLFERCVETCDPGMKQRLVIQRRMIEPIAKIVKDTVYGGDYLTPSKTELETTGLHPLVTPNFKSPLTFIDTTSYGQKAKDISLGSGYINSLEIEAIIWACDRYESDLKARGDKKITVSILCFYKAQSNEIKKRLGYPGYQKFSKLKFQVIDAIDRIQGQESDLVMISFCRTHFGNPSPRFGQWLQDIRRLNVACTRAHRALVFVGHQRTLTRLCSTAESSQFFKNLIDMFASGDPEWTVIKAFK